jgi:TonB-dependent Receptor Plug Domain/TonB dependent receptor
MKRAVVIAVLVASTASAETGAWQGYRALGVQEAQLAALDFITVDGMRRGGLVDRVVSDQRTADRCGIKVACHCEALRKRGVRFGAFGSIGHLGDLWTVELTLIDAHGCTVAASELLSESLADAEIASRLATLAQRLATPQNQVVETATGSERSVDATPSIVTTFTRQQLRGLQIRNLDDLLPLVPGYDVVDANWGSVVLNQGLQSTLLFLANGIPLINAQTNFRALGRDFRASLAHVDKIEIVRGPGSVLYGQNAFLGVINMISEVPTRREAVIDAGISSSSLRTEEVWVRGGENRGRYGFTASVDVGRRFGTKTYVPDSPQAIVAVPAPFPYGNGGETHNAPDTWFDATLRLEIDQRVELVFQNLTNEMQWEISPLGALLDEGAGGYWKKTHRLYAVAGKHTLYEEENASVVAHARVSRYELYSDENFAIQPRWPDGPVPTTGRDLRLGLRSDQGNPDPRTANQLDLRVIHELENWCTNRLMGGVNVLHQHLPSSYATLLGIDEEVEKPFESFQSRMFLSMSAFALDEFTPMPWLVLMGGARVQMDRIYSTERGGRDPITDWKYTANVQGGAAVTRGPFGAKLIYSEGFRAPDAVQLFSRAGTKGNPDLKPEKSRSFAAEAHFAPARELTVRAGGDYTRVSRVILLDPIVGDPMFAYTPTNKGTIDIASAFVAAQLSLPLVDAFGSFHFAHMDESDPLANDGIPYAKQTAAAGVVYRPLPDLSIFFRSSLASGRTTYVTSATEQDRRVETDVTLRMAVGAAVKGAILGADLELSIDNPLRLEHDAPYKLDGTTNLYIERRRGSEVFATLRYER